MKAKIIEAVKKDWLEEIRDDDIGFLDVTALQMLEHLKVRGGELDFVDTTKLEEERDEPWNPAEHVTSYFVRVERCRKVLTRARIQTNETSLRNKALNSFRSSGEFKLAINDW